MQQNPIIYANWMHYMIVLRCRHFEARSSEKELSICKPKTDLMIEFINKVIATIGPDENKTKPAP